MEELSALSRAMRSLQDARVKWAKISDHPEPQSVAKRPGGSSPADLPPLSEVARKVYEILCALPKTAGITAKELVKELADKDDTQTSEETIRKGIRNELRPWGLMNKPGVGYYIPVSRRPLPPAGT